MFQDKPDERRIKFELPQYWRHGSPRVVFCSVLSCTNKAAAFYACCSLENEHQITLATKSGSYLPCSQAA